LLLSRDLFEDHTFEAKSKANASVVVGVIRVLIAEIRVTVKVGGSSFGVRVRIRLLFDYSGHITVYSDFFFMDSPQL